MPDNLQQIVQELWNYCNVLRDDGVSYGDHVEQLTNLLFLPGTLIYSLSAGLLTSLRCLGAGKYGMTKP